MIPKMKEFEKVKVDEWINGEITKIEYDLQHEFIFKGEKKIGPAVKVQFQLDSYKDKKSTGWWSFNYSDKSKVYKFFIQPLVEGATPNMKFDFDNLLNLRIKVMYAQNGEYQNIFAVRPSQGKILPGVAKEPNEAPLTAEEEVQF